MNQTMDIFIYILYDDKKINLELNTPIQIGRDEDTNFQILNQYVSRKHCEVK